MNFIAAYPHLAARIFNVALLIHPQKLDAIIAGVGQRLLGAQILHNAADGILPPELFSTKKGSRADRGYQVVDGVAVLNVSGALVHKTRMEADSSTLLGYNSIAADLEHAMDHPDVHAVLQIWDSPGGESQGAFEYADRALALRGKKPFYAIADGMAASAGYLGASAAQTLAITSTGYAGSIGVVMRHVDLSAALMQEGVRVSHIYAGTKKIDGNSFEPLSAAVRADFQAEVDSLYASFIDTVARARNLNPDAIRATQAATYRGTSAIGIGLVDRLSTADTLISELSAQRARIHAPGMAGRLSTADQGATMSQTSTPGGQTPATLPPAAAAAAPAPTGSVPAQPAALTQSDLNAAVATGVTAERKRIESILEHPNASAQTALARQCIATGLSVEQSTAILGAVVTTAAPAAANSFTAAMAAMGNPKVSGIEAPSGAGADQLAQAEALAKSVLQSMQVFA